MYVEAIVLCSSISCVQSAATHQGGTTERKADVWRIHIGGKRVFGEVDLMPMKFANDSAGTAEFKRNIVPIERQASGQRIAQAVDRNVKSSTSPKTVRRFVNRLHRSICLYPQTVQLPFMPTSCFNVRSIQYWRRSTDCCGEGGGNCYTFQHGGVSS